MKVLTVLSVPRVLMVLVLRVLPVLPVLLVLQVLQAPVVHAQQRNGVIAGRVIDTASAAGRCPRRWCRSPGPGYASGRPCRRRPFRRAFSPATLRPSFPPRRRSSPWRQARSARPSTSSSDLDQNEWFDPAVLERLSPLATPFTIAGYDQASLDLTIR